MGGPLLQATDLHPDAGPRGRHVRRFAVVPEGPPSASAILARLRLASQISGLRPQADRPQADANTVSNTSSPGGDDCPYSRSLGPILPANYEETISELLESVLHAASSAEWAVIAAFTAATANAATTSLALAAPSSALQLQEHLFVARGAAAALYARLAASKVAEDAGATAKAESMVRKLRNEVDKLQAEAYALLAEPFV